MKLKSYLQINILEPHLSFSVDFQSLLTQTNNGQLINGEVKPFSYNSVSNNSAV